RAADEVHIKILAPVFDFDLFKRTFGGDGDFRIIAARRVDQHRRRAERGFDFAMAASETFATGGVGGEKLRAPVLLRDPLRARFAALAVASEHGHARARAGKSFSERAAEHARRADNYCDFTGKIKEIGHVK